MSIIDMSRWTGRVDSEEHGIALRWHQVIRPWSRDLSGGNTLIGFCCDIGVSRNHGRVGAAAGPTAIRAALANIAWHGVEPLFDSGDVHGVNDDLEVAQASLAQTITGILHDRQRPIVMGGGHEVAWASWQGLASFAATQRPAARIGIVNFDAHFDLRQAARGNSGTPFRQIAEDCAQRGWPFRYACLGVAQTANTQALFERARQLNVWWEHDTHMRPEHLGERAQALRTFADSVEMLFVTIDLDVLPAYVAPGVSALASYGVELAVIESLLDTLLDTRKVALLEIAELNPRFDIDHRTARVAARLITRCCHHSSAH